MTDVYEWRTRTFNQRSGRKWMASGTPCRPRNKIFSSSGTKKLHSFQLRANGMPRNGGRTIGPAAPMASGMPDGPTAPIGLLQLGVGPSSEPPRRRTTGLVQHMANSVPTGEGPCGLLEFIAEEFRLDVKACCARCRGEGCECVVQTMFRLVRRDLKPPQGSFESDEGGSNGTSSQGA